MHLEEINKLYLLDLVGHRILVGQVSQFRLVVHPFLKLNENESFNFSKRLNHSFGKGNALYLIIYQIDAVFTQQTHLKFNDWSYLVRLEFLADQLVHDHLFFKKIIVSFELYFVFELFLKLKSPFNPRPPINPVSPFSPSGPGKPSRPSIPGSPLGPVNPGRPMPGNPASPFKPIWPGNPEIPFEKTLSISKLANIQNTALFFITIIRNHFEIKSQHLCNMHYKRELSLDSIENKMIRIASIIVLHSWF